MVSVVAFVIAWLILAVLLGGFAWTALAAFGWLCLEAPGGRKVARDVEETAVSLRRVWDGTDEPSACAPSATGSEESGYVSVRLSVAGSCGSLVSMTPRGLACSKPVLDAAAFVRCKIGLPKDNEANRLVVRRLVSEYLSELKDLRNGQRMLMEPIAVMLAFQPTSADVFARDLEASAELTLRRDDYRAVRYHHEDGWWARIAEWPGLGVFGRQRRFTPIGA